MRGKNEEKLLGAKVEIINALGSFVDEHTINLEFEDHSEQITGDKIYINMGAYSWIPSIEGVKESKYVYTSVVKAEDIDGGVKLYLNNDEALEVSGMLVATGRRPLVDKLNVEKAGV